jgi:hypothetical protein
MGTIEKVALAVVAVAFVTTLVLPDRKTPQVIGSIADLFTRSVKTAMGRG